MATAETTIKKENFSASWQKNYNVPSHSNKDQVRYIYICAPCWYIVAGATFAAFGGSGVFQIYLSYWTGKEWSAETHYEVNAAGGNVTRRYAHNRDEGNLNGSHHNAYPLWRIRYWPSKKNSRWSLSFYVGGWGVARKTSTGEWLNYPLEKRIYSIGRAGDGIHDAGTTQNHPFVYSNRSGNPILAAYDHELVYYPYLS